MNHEETNLPYEPKTPIDSRIISFQFSLGIIANNLNKITELFKKTKDAELSAVCFIVPDTLHNIGNDVDAAFRLLQHSECPDLLTEYFNTRIEANQNIVSKVLLKLREAQTVKFTFLPEFFTEDQVKVSLGHPWESEAESELKSTSLVFQKMIEPMFFCLGVLPAAVLFGRADEEYLKQAMPYIDTLFDSWKRPEHAQELEAAYQHWLAAFQPFANEVVAFQPPNPITKDENHGFQKESYPKNSGHTLQSASEIYKSHSHPRKV